MKKLVLTVIGEDQVGLVENLSNVLVANHACWLASNLSHLSGYFAGVVEVEVEESHIADFTSALQNVEGLKIEVHDAVSHEPMSEQEIEFVITGNDRTGIVQELSSIITHKGASIVHFTSSRQSAPNWGGGLFHAVAKVSLPLGMDPDIIAESLEQLASDIVVDMEEAC